MKTREISPFLDVVSPQRFSSDFPDISRRLVRELASAG